MTQPTEEEMARRLERLQVNVAKPKDQKNSTSETIAKFKTPMICLVFTAIGAVCGGVAGHQHANKSAQISTDALDWLTFEIAEKYGILPDAARKMVNEKLGL